MEKRTDIKQVKHAKCTGHPRKTYEAGSRYPESLKGNGWLARLDGMVPGRLNGLRDDSWSVCSLIDPLIRQPIDGAVVLFVAS
jgi:hypothetical protein